MLKLRSNPTFVTNLSFSTPTQQISEPETFFTSFYQTTDLQEFTEAHFPLLWLQEPRVFKGNESLLQTFLEDHLCRIK